MNKLDSSAWEAWREAGWCICKLDSSGRERGVKQWVYLQA